MRRWLQCSQARKIVNYLDPVGVGARDLKECLLIQICAQQREAAMVLGRRQKKHVEQWRRQYGCG